MFKRIWLVVGSFFTLALLVCSFVGSQVRAEGPAVFPLPRIGSQPINCEYTLGVTQNPTDPKEYFVWAPNEVITPLRLEAAAGFRMISWTGRSVKFDGEVQLPPFQWRPGTVTGWGTTLHFETPPQIVVVGMISRDNQAQVFRTACGCSLLSGPETSSTHLPTLMK